MNVLHIDIAYDKMDFVPSLPTIEMKPKYPSCLMMLMFSTDNSPAEHNNVPTVMYFSFNIVACK